MAETHPLVKTCVTSADGTSLAAMEMGAGPPLVICHGAFTMAQDWLPFANHLAATRRIILYDRRGRGDSRAVESPAALDAEVDDLAAIVSHAGAGAAILGHSFGGACTLAYAARGGFDGQLIVYEPPHPAFGPVSRGLVPEIERLIATGDLDAATAFAMSGVVGMPPPAIDAFRLSPLWVAMCQTVTAFPAELRFLDSLAWRPGNLDAIKGAPTLLLGSETPGQPEAIVSLQRLIPALRTVTIPGQGHVAYLQDAKGLATIVASCLEEGGILPA